MSSLLDWRYISKQDRAERQRFTCAEPPKYRYGGGRLRHHPRPWEMDVQSFLRSHVPGPSQVMLAGRDGYGLAALSAWDESPAGAVLLQAVAVTSRLRHQGGAWAVEMMEETLGRIEARALARGGESPLVIARIDRRNTPSAALCSEMGWVRLGPMDAGVTRTIDPLLRTISIIVDLTAATTHLDEWTYSFKS